MNILHDLAVTAAKNPISAISIITLIIAMISNKIRQFIFYGVARLVNSVAFLFIRRTYLHKSLGDAVISYLLKNGYKVKRFSGELYGEDPAYIRSEADVRHVLYKDTHSNTQWFWGKGWPVVVSGEPLIQVKDTVKNYSYIVYTFRWTNTLSKLLDDATEFKNAAKLIDEEDENNHKFVVKRVSGGKFFVEQENAKLKEMKTKIVSEEELADPFSTVIPIRWDKDNIGQVFAAHNTMGMMSLNPELEGAIEEIKFWLDHQEWYEERGIPWKRGLLFYGPPGSGKTMLCRAVAEKFNLPLIIFDLSSMDSNEFVHTWSQLLPRRIALFEDFDAVFDKRTNLLDSGLDFSTILNVLDGADKKQGILTIITTNHPEKLDHALGGALEGEEFKKTDKMPSRPGRIDRSVEFLPLSREGRVKLVSRIVKDDKLTQQIVDAGMNDSPAQIQERSMRIAIDLLYKEEKAKNKKLAGG